MTESPTSRRSDLFKSLASLAGLALATSAVAQTGKSPAPPSTDTDNQLAEVTVTARFRSEGINNTPIAITALTGADMDQRGMDNVLNVASDTPNVVLREGQSGYGKSAVAFIRGIGQNDFSFALEPGVGIYVDDVYYATIYGSVFDLVDVDHVEVLRGPQGTLFGKNSEGGAIRLYSVKPKGDDSGYVDVGYGSYNRTRFRGAYDFSIVPDVLTARVSAYSNKQDGFVKTIDFACAHPALAGNLQPTIRQAAGTNCVTGDEGSEDTQSVRGVVRFQPSDTLQALFEADYTQDKGSPAPAVMLAIDPNIPGAGLAGFNTSVAIPTYGIPLDSRFIPSNRNTTYSNFADSRLGLIANPVNNVNQFGGQMTVMWDASPDLHLKSVTAYRAYTGNFAQDGDGSPLPALSSYQYLNHHQISEEATASGTVQLFSRPLEWTVGGYYLDSYSQQQGYADLAEFGLAFNINDPVVDLNRSGFLHGIYHFTDKLSLELGYRYTTENKESWFSNDLMMLGGLPASGLLFPVTEGHAHSARNDYKGALSYQVTDSTLTYVSVTTGFKAGGINPRPVDAAQIVPFGPETVTSYEIGAKTQLFDRRMDLRVAAFYSDYKNLQQNAIGVDNTGTVANLVTNVGRVAISGAELEVHARPARGLNLDASVGGFNYNTLSLGSAALIGVAAGGPTLDSLPIGVPLWKADVGADYTIPLGNLGDVTPRADYSYQPKTYWDLARSPELTMGGYGLLNLHLTYHPPKGKWEAAFQVTNATNKVFFQNYGPNLTQYGLLDGVIGAPREFFGNIRYSF